MPSAKRIIWSRPSKQDLRDIWAYYVDAASLEIAGRLLHDIESAARRASERPMVWRIRADLGLEIRSIPVRPYRIFFQIVEQDIEIIRILHERRDIVAVFAGGRKS